MFLQAAPQQPGSLINAFLPFIFILGIFYLIVFRPARNRQKQLQEMIENLKTGDEVITNGGIHGTVSALRGDKLQLRIADSVKIDISRNAVASLQQPEKE